MGGQSIVFILVAFILTGFLTSCFTKEMQCYVCNSAFHPDCADSPVPEKYLVLCTPQTSAALQPPSNQEHTRRRDVVFSVPKDTEFTICRKNVFTIPQQNNGNETKESETRTVRSCGFLNKEPSSCKWAANHGIQNYMCQCDQDACNSAVSTTWTWSIFVSSSVVILRAMF